MIRALIERRRLRIAAEAEARADAADMMARLGYYAHDVARRNARAEDEGVGADIFPPDHWARVRRIIREAFPRERRP